jgi:DUF1365 family protein
MRSSLYAGNVRHRREPPRAYAFTYGVFYVSIDLDEVNDVDRRLRLLSHNRLNLLSFRDADHQNQAGRPLGVSMRAHLRRRGIEAGSISLLTYPRVLNYVFNPVSFYLVRDGGGTLRHVTAEVHNTHGERHLYDLARDGAGPGYSAAADKAFYVSPFIDMDVRYEFRIVEDAAGCLDIRIDEFRGNKRFFQADLRLAPRPLTDANIARMLARYPFVTLKTIALIHWHGLRLWLRGEPYRKHAPQRDARP